jgi:GT2 family glycosyltransferase/tetratricopeptide (TPR) repeat protein
MISMSLDQTALSNIATRADRFRDNRNWLSAAVLYGEMLEKAPPTTHAWVQYAHMLKEAELFEEAIRAYEFAISFDGTEPDPRLHLAHLLKRLGRAAEALEAFQRLSELPDAPRVEQEIAGLRVALMQAEQKGVPTNFSSNREGAIASVCLEGFSKLARREQARLAEIAEQNRELDTKMMSSCLSAVDVFKVAKVRTLRTRLNPKSAMVIRDGKYLSTTKNPQFSIVVEGDQLRPGWFSIELEIWGKAIAFAPVLYVEHRMDWSRFLTFRLKPAGNGRFFAVGFIEDAVLRLRLDPADCEGTFIVKVFNLCQIPLAKALRHAYRVDRKAARTAFKDIRAHKSLRQFSRDLARIVSYQGPSPYETWIARHDTPSDEDLARYERAIGRWQNQPLISVVVSIDQNFKLLEETLRSLRVQIYGNWQLHLVVSSDVSEETRCALRSLAQSDTRIIPVFAADRLLAHTVLDACNGRFVLLIAQGDALASTALYRFVERYLEKPLSKLIYSDEDTIEQAVRHSPLFKPDWDPDYFYASNYLGQPVFFDVELARKCCPSVAEFPGFDVHDLVLRASEVLSANEITHIARVLYHRHGSPEADATTILPYSVTERRKRAIEESLERQARQATLVAMPGGLCRVIWPVPDPAPLVTLIIPTRDYAHLLRGCIESIQQKTDYPAIEIVVVDNGSAESDTLAYFDSLRSHGRIHILDAPGPFNFSRLNNIAVEQAKGSVVALINNDVVATDSDWLREMVSQAIRPEIGAVGAKLVYETGHIQHAGIVCGIGLVAAHPHKFRASDDPGYMGRISAAQSLSAVTAACLVVEKAKYRQVGGMDEENLKIAFNDVDLCLKLDAAGYRNVYTPHATLIHLESISRGLDTSPEKANRYQAEASFMRAKWGDKIKRDQFYNVNLTTEREDFSFRD